MIGAELLVCFQVVLLSNCPYQKWDMFTYATQGTGAVTGGWPLFGTALNPSVPTLTNRILMSLTFLNNSFIVVSLLLLFSLILAALDPRPQGQDTVGEGDLEITGVSEGGESDSLWSFAVSPFGGVLRAAGPRRLRLLSATVCQGVVPGVSDCQLAGYFGRPRPHCLSGWLRNIGQELVGPAAASRRRSSSRSRGGTSRCLWFGASC
jgi:hypothetical protein